MRITADVVLRARAFINPVKDRELDLRGYKIPLIENLGVTQDQFDTIDLSDNEIKRLDNFPRLRRLKALLLSNNFINRIGSDLGDQISNLESLLLTNNKVTSLSELDHLGALKRLTTLSLLDNPVVRQQHYRAYVIHRLPSLKVLDFKKVKLEERKAAAKLFRSEAGRQLEDAVAQEGQALAEEAEQDGAKKGALTDEQKRVAAAMIDSAKTPEELDRVERMLRAGIFRSPDGTTLPAAPQSDVLSESQQAAAVKRPAPATSSPAKHAANSNASPSGPAAQPLTTSAQSNSEPAAKKQKQQHIADGIATPAATADGGTPPA